MQGPKRSNRKDKNSRLKANQPALANNLKTFMNHWKVDRPTNLLSSWRSFAEDVFGYEANKVSSRFLNVLHGTIDTHDIVLLLPAKAISRLEEKANQGIEFAEYYDRAITDLINVCVLIDLEFPVEVYRKRLATARKTLLQRKKEANARDAQRIQEQLRQHASQDSSSHTTFVPKLHLRAPNPVPYFVGQENYLKQLRLFCDQDAERICLVYGKLGKSELVRKFLSSEELSDRFPGGIGYVDCCDVDPATANQKRLTLSKVMLAILRAGVASEVREPDSFRVLHSQFTKHLKNMVRNKRDILLAIDNVVEGMETDKLVEWVGGRSRIILVSSDNLALRERYRSLELDGRLESNEVTAESLRLRFKRWLSSGELQDEDIRELALKSQCRIDTIDDIAAQLNFKLRDADATKVKVKMDWLRVLGERKARSYSNIIARIPETEAAWLRPLSVFIGHFDEHMAAEILTASDVPKIDNLENRICHFMSIYGILDLDPESRSFRFSDPQLRQLLLESLSVKHTDAIMPAYSRLYVEKLRNCRETHLAAAASSARTKRGKSERLLGILMQFTTQFFPDVLRAFSWAATAGLFEKAPAETFRELLKAGASVLPALQNAHELRDLGRSGLEVIDAESEPLFIYHALELLTLAYYRVSLYGNSRSLSKQRVDIARTLRNDGHPSATELLVEALWDLGHSAVHVSMQMKEPLSINSFAEAETLLQPVFSGQNGNYWKCQNEAHMGWAAMHLGKEDDAAQRLTAAKEMAEDLGDFGTAVRCRIDYARNLRKAAARLKSHTLAEQALTYSLAALEKHAEPLGSPYLIALGHRNLSLAAQTRMEIGHINTEEQLELLDLAIEEEQHWLDWKTANQHPYPGRTRRKIRQLKEQLPK